MELYIMELLNQKNTVNIGTEPKMDVLDQIFHILISADLLPSINLTHTVTANIFQ